MAAEDPWVSAVVTLRPPDPALMPPAEGGVSPEQRAASLVKSKLTAAGFEVHAPIGTSFSIAATRSKFEETFAVTLVVDEEQLTSSVTVEGGGRELSVDHLDEEIRPFVAAIEFMPPLEIASP